MSASANDSSSSAATACLHVAIGDWQEFLEEARRALMVLEKLDQEPDEPEKRSESGIGGSSTAVTPDDLSISNIPLNNVPDSSSKNKKKKKKKKNKKASTSGAGSKPSEQSDESSGDEASHEVNAAASSAASTISGSEFTATASALPGDTEAIRLAEADKLAAQGTALARSGEPNALTRAVQLLSSAIQLYPHRAGYYGNRSLCFFRMGDFTSSLNDAQLALERESTNLKYLNRKAQALIQLKRQSDARAVAEQMLQLSPNNEVALQILEDIRRQLVEDNYAAAHGSGVKQADELSDDGDTISCAPSSVMFPPVRPVSVTVTNLPTNCAQPVLRSVFTNAGIAVTNMSMGSTGPGSATVFVVNAESARQAVSKLNGYILESKVLRFELAR